MRSIDCWHFLALAVLPASAVCASAQTAVNQAPSANQAPIANQAPLGSQEAVSSTPTEGSVQPRNYRLGPNDHVTITVYGEDDLSREYIVSPTGQVSLPLIGDMVAQGRTAEELRDEIEHRLAAGFINNPAVTVSVSTFRNFYILGEVNKPGEYPYESGLTVTQAVAEAAGYTYRAARRYVFVKHEGETIETRVPITAGMLVQPGDTIRLGERYF